MLMPMPPNGDQRGVEGLNDVFSVAPTPTTTSHAAEDEPQSTLPKGPRKASLPLSACSDLDRSASTCRSEIIADHTISDGANHASAGGHTPNTRLWAHDLRCAEPQPAQLLSEGNEDHARLGAAPWSSHERLNIVVHKDPKMLWAKALWWATQEAGRRRAQKLAEEITAPYGQRRLSGMRMRTTISMAKKVLHTGPKVPSTVVPLEVGHTAGGPFAEGRGEEVGGGVVGGKGMFRRVAGIARMLGRSPSNLVSPEPEPAPGAGEAAAAHPICKSPSSIFKSGKFNASYIHRLNHGDSNAEIAALGSPGGKKPAALSSPVRVESVLRENFTRLMRSKVYIGFTILCTLWVLGGEDVYMLHNPPVWLDKNVFVLSIVCAALFLLDLLVRSTYEAGYSLSFWFWLDVIALISLLPEVIWVVAEIDVFSSGAAGLARSGRAASAGTRVVRILRILKLLKQLYELKKRNIRTDRNQLGDNSTSEISRKLEDYVTIHVMIAVAAMLVLSLALTVAYACTEESVLEVALPIYLRSLAECMGKQEEARPKELYSRTCIERWKLENLEDIRQRFGNKANPQPVIFLNVSNVTLLGSPDNYRQLRKKPQAFLIFPLRNLSVGDGEGSVHVDIMSTVQEESASNLATVSCVLIVIMFLSVTLTSSMRTEIVGPMERIVKIIESLILDPLGVQAQAGEGGKELGVQGGRFEACWKKLWKKWKRARQGAHDKHVYAVERAILRVRDLLRLGLGEAGAQIISANMKDGGLVLTQTGKLVHAIFGFCDIRNFTDCTEVLRADIVKLVNGVARHVHMCTKDSHGAPNKNIGDAFLLVWKPKGEMSISDVADASLQSYVRVIVQMQMCDDLRRLERRSALQHRMPGFQVRLGFGLHYGWAVEGAIGSEHKIDVSYLSPHVNMASRLEAATKQYGTAILLSDSIFGLISETIQSQCRLVDRVTVKGSQQPVSLYTYDVPDIKSRGGILPDDVRLSDPSLSIKDFFRTVVPPATTFEFRRLHNAGVQLYLGGPDGSRSNWPEAATVLRHCLDMRPLDGPSLAILHAMETLCQEDGRAPEGWPGFRPLTEK